MNFSFSFPLEHFLLNVYIDRKMHNAPSGRYTERAAKREAKKALETSIADHLKGLLVDEMENDAAFDRLGDFSLKCTLSALSVSVELSAPEWSEVLTSAGIETITGKLFCMLHTLTTYEQTSREFLAWLSRLPYRLPV